MPYTDKVNGTESFLPRNGDNYNYSFSGADHSSTNGSSGDASQYEITNRGYGKSYIKLLHVEKDGPVHTIREYEVNTRLRLRTKKDYLTGDNSDIIATDTQKNTVYLLAKKHGVESPESFSLLVASHFLYTYSHVEEVTVHVEEYPWQRLNQEHNHAFVFTPTALRCSTVTQKRNDKPQITGGLKGLRVLKTTQSAFTNFMRDDYRTLPDAPDRVFSTVVTASWQFSSTNGVNYDSVWNTVKECILNKFAGPSKEGIFSPSVQNTLYLAEKMVLDKIPQIQSIEMEMPNKHYYPMNWSKFPSSVVVHNEKREVFEPADKPSGIIQAVLERRQSNNIIAKL